MQPFFPSMKHHSKVKVKCSQHRCVLTRRTSFLGVRRGLCTIKGEEVLSCRGPVQCKLAFIRQGWPTEQATSQQQHQSKARPNSYLQNLGRKALKKLEHEDFSTPNPHSCLSASTAGILRIIRSSGPCHHSHCRLYHKNHVASNTEGEYKMQAVSWAH